MLEINAEIVRVIEQDYTIQLLTGYTPGDTRVYAWNPSEDIVYSSSKKAAIIYRSSMGKRPPRWSFPKQYVNFTTFFKVISIDQETTDKISEQMIWLFDLNRLNTTNWHIGSCELLSYNDAIPEGTPQNTQWVKMVSIMFTNVFRRTPVPVVAS